MSHYSGRRDKKKTCLQDFVIEQQREEAEEAAALEAAAEAAKRRGSRPPQSLLLPPQASNSSSSTTTNGTPLKQRSLHREQIQPLVDLAYSDQKLVQQSAIGLLATLSINSENKDMLIAAGSLKPMLASCSSTVDITVRRYALSGLAQMTAREDIAQRLCSVPGGLKACIEGCWCKDLLSRLAASECVANVAASLRLRGQLVAAGALPAIGALLTAAQPQLKRWGMVTLQRLAVCTKGAKTITTKEDPEGDGYAQEIMAEGVLFPLLQLLKGGPTIDEELRTVAMHTLHEMANASDDVKKRLVFEHAELVRLTISLLLLEDHMGAATQREASKVVTLLASLPPNLPLLLRSGILDTLTVLSKGESAAKKQLAATLLHCFATDSECRKALLESGAARTLCMLSRPTLPKRVTRPAVAALVGLSQLGACVLKLLEAGAGATLAALASSSDPDLRQDGVRALADMLEADVGEPLRVADLLLQQGALAVFFSNAYARDRTMQLASSRGLLRLAKCSPTHARIIARKGAARPLSALLLGRETVLSNAVVALYELSSALVAARTGESSLKPNLKRVRGVLEVGVVGTPKELWARLNDDAGMPAAAIMRVARSSDALGGMARAILHNLRPEAGVLVDTELPERSGDSREAIAARMCHWRCTLKIQKLFREARARRSEAADAPRSPRPFSMGAGDLGLFAAAFGQAAYGSKDGRGGRAAITPRVRAAKSASLKELRAAMAEGVQSGGAPSAALMEDDPLERETSPHARHVLRTMGTKGGVTNFPGQMPDAAVTATTEHTPGRLPDAAQLSGPPDSQGSARGASIAATSRTRSGGAEAFRTPAARRAKANDFDLSGYSGMQVKLDLPPGSLSAALSLPGSAQNMAQAMRSSGGVQRAESVRKPTPPAVPRSEAPGGGRGGGNSESPRSSSRRTGVFAPRTSH
jgi:hypothetical protein